MDTTRARQKPMYTPTRDSNVYAIYALSGRMPITVSWPSCTQTLQVTILPYPPHCVLEFIMPGRSHSTVCPLQSVKHGEILVRHGFKVRVPSPLDLFCGRLVREGHGAVVAWPHSDVPWLSNIALEIDRLHPDSRKDAYWCWRRWANVVLPSNQGAPAPGRR